METVTATFSIPDWINEGLKTKAYERVGGVIRDFRTKQIVAMLRETVPYLTQPLTILSQFGSAASILNLGVSVIGFVVVIKRLGEIEQRLKIVQEDVNKLNLKFNLSVYANFRAALDLARDAFTMNKLENRINMANLAINRFLEAQHIYAGSFETVLEENIEVADEYLKSLFLTYVARARCYLELEEIDTALHCLQEGAEFLSQSVKKFILSTFQYLNQEEKEQFYKNHTILVPPTHLAVNNVISGVIGGWTTLRPKVEPFFLEASLLAIEPIIPIPGVLLALTTQIAPITAAPVALFSVAVLLKTLLDQKSKQEVEPKLTQKLEKIEAQIEAYYCFEAYQAEIQAMSKLNINFKDWLTLTPLSDMQTEKLEVLYIIPSTPLQVEVCNYSIFDYE
ncbi:hypothetical protein [Nostoc sp. CALU 546]|uniref:hypothetical protein n=1 Tax=Nostoc sp. CALU 546 TaxID=1867241 RepID=UPI003B68321F